ncbi:microtubule integrity protein mal3 [Stygiomarasmius scandens]|uniref:Microtubule integrity protein mal3 n=1 Tax=Marasmiellus scandens TaxID=2682957 RepID=A0ABR1J5A8_9AGAR
MTSRVDLLEWLNDLLQIHYTKIEQCGTGAAYCQIFDSIYGDVQLNKVNWKAQHEYQYIANFKVLQSAFTSKKVDKPIPIERLVKCRMQDNLEFLQWMKRYWDQTYHQANEYDPLARRGGTNISMGGAPPPKSGSKSNARLAPSSAASAGGKWSSGASVAGSETTSGSGRSGSRTAFSPFSMATTASSASMSRGPSRASSRSGYSAAGAGGADVKKVKELKEHVEQLSASAETMRVERDFYFNKLRDVEDIVTGVLEGGASEGTEERILETLKKIQGILYAGDEQQ